MPKKLWIFYFEWTRVESLSQSRPVLLDTVHQWTQRMDPSLVCSRVRSSDTDKRWRNHFFYIINVIFFILFISFSFVYYSFVLGSFLDISKEISENILLKKVVIQWEYCSATATTTLKYKLIFDKLSEPCFLE